MDSRREFIKKAMMLGGAAGMATLPASIQKALAINPAAGSTFLDADHVIFLMQENRSFDHAFGTLRGVRGFNDPRAMRLPNNNAVWLQTNANGETYAPFRLDIKDTKVTWMGSLPHSRESQVAARNEGRHDNWLEAKKPDGDYGDMPLTMGYYTREDIPFYYALADAFTVCDQNFCSSLTGTDPNRLHFWSGTIRSKHNEDAKAYTFNGEVENGVDWRTFPELLEANNISWKVYQNEMSVENGMTDEEDQWLGNFGDNVLEYFTQYNVKHLKSYVDFLPERIKLLKADVAALKIKIDALPLNSDEHKQAEKKLKSKQSALKIAEEDIEKYSAESFNNLPQHQKNIHEKAFVINDNDPHQRQLIPLNYTDDTINREINIPKGDLLFQFRKDVEEGKLPTVSWLVAPENFSDHPDSPWFGAWYVSEAMDILTGNPEVWKKTIFILAYDENDGYYDHVPPFVAPQHGKPETGLASKEIDTRLDHVKAEADVVGPIGLGYRVPLVIASPWSRGGYVNSQVFDHTSSLRFLEVFLNKKFNTSLKEDNITPWRRTVCGDLTSVFRTYTGAQIEALPFLKKDALIETVHKAKFKNVPSNYKSLSTAEVASINKNPGSSLLMPQQEKGIKSACALPYELYANGSLNANKSAFVINLRSGNTYFKNEAAGAPFIIHAYGKKFSARNYTLAANDQLFDKTLLTEFNNNNYDIQLHAPNGFFRSFKGNMNDPSLLINFRYDDESWGNQSKLPSLTGSIIVSFINPDIQNLYTITITDNSYNAFEQIVKDIQPVNKINKPVDIKIDTGKDFGWYDFSIAVQGNKTFEHRYAGHVETGKESKTDPLMGRVV